MMEGWVIMRTLKLRTKIEIIIAIAFVMSLVVSSVISINRTISDTHDDVDTFIRNSNGNYWEATGTNIQAAIDDFGITAPPNSGYGGVHAYVYLPGNTTITVSSTINIKDHITLDMQGCEIKPSGNIDVFKLDKGAQIRNGIINVSGVATYNSKAIMLNTLDYPWQKEHPVIIEDMVLASESGRGVGICFNTSSASDQRATNVQVEDIDIKNFEYGIVIDHTSTGDSYINGNMFARITIYNCTYPIKVYESVAEASGNYFRTINIYCNSSTEYIIWNNGHGNQYDGIFVFNWDNNSGTRTSYNFTEKFSGDWSGAAHSCYLCFQGGGNDLSFPPWHQWQNAYTILNLEKSELIIGNVVEENP